MRELLQQAIAAIEKLPAEVQDAIATRLLAEAADEQAWAAQFEATTDAQWDRMAETLRRAIAAEDITPLDDVFPPREPSLGLGYRALGLREADHIYWFWIGSHAEYDELLRRL
jgi:hypothetical protein